MADLLIKEAELQQLDRVIGDIPTKYGMPLAQFFQLIGQKRQAEEQAAVEKRDREDIVKVNTEF
jgi:hypothetical protein